MHSNNSVYSESNDQFFTEEQTLSVNFSLRVRRRMLSKRTAYQQLELVETIKRRLKQWAIACKVVSRGQP